MYRCSAPRDYPDRFQVANDAQRPRNVTRTRESASGRSRTGCGMERRGARPTIVLRELMSGPLRPGYNGSFW